MSQISTKTNNSAWFFTINELSKKHILHEKTFKSFIKLKFWPADLNNCHIGHDIYLTFCLYSLDTGLDKSRTCTRDVLETINFTNCRTGLFLTSTLTKIRFQFLSTWRNLKTLGVQILYNNTYARFLKPTIVILFFISYFVLHLTIWTLIIISQYNLQWSFLPFFKWGKPLKEKLNFKHLDGTFGMLLLLGFLKIPGFCLCENEFYYVAAIMTKKVNIFC